MYKQLLKVTLGRLEKRGHPFSAGGEPCYITLCNKLSLKVAEGGLAKRGHPSSAGERTMLHNIM